MYIMSILEFFLSDNFKYILGLVFFSDKEASTKMSLGSIRNGLNSTTTTTTASTMTTTTTTEDLSASSPSSSTPSRIVQ